ncbi:MAG: GNAT family N-acetyltransferase [Myxococcota bacterium]|jgi:Leu/Phe-tRNA-protein transferase|nr:GNAT family N-acetyltransferase [Myxococcota bacterium]
MIEYIPAEILQTDLLERLVYPNLEQTLYWSDRWDPDFYVTLARAGFICIATDHDELGPLLIPEMQDRYAVLDWPELHLSKNLRRIIRTGRLELEGISLRTSDPRNHVLPRIVEQYGSDCWVLDTYRALMEPLLDDPIEGFALHGIELWSTNRDEPIAGEFGYSIGASYTSLSGFCSPADPQWRHFGTLQQVLLARTLEAQGYAFWNLGHPDMPYKHALGARPLPRAEFLGRWFHARDERPEQPLENDEALVWSLTDLDSCRAPWPG